MSVGTGRDSEGGGRMTHPETVHAPLLTALLLILFLVSACRDSFEPHQENDRYLFSIYGYLDSSTDTQWVRITPIRDILIFDDNPVNADVTLQDLETDMTIVLNDSLFSYALGARAHNYWTNEPLTPGRTYRLEVRQNQRGSEAGNGSNEGGVSGGNGVSGEGAENPIESGISSATVTLPPDFPPPIVFRPDAPEDRERATEPDEIYINGVKFLADVRMLYLVRNEENGRELVLTLPFMDRVVPGQNPDSFYLEIEPEEFIERPEAIVQEMNSRFGSMGEEVEFSVLHHQLFVAAAGPEWPDFGLLDEQVQALPDGVSNVENGVGYLAGIVSKAVPYMSCSTPGVLVPCPEEKPLAFR